MGIAAILVMWPGPVEQTFVPHPMEAPYEFWLIGPVVSEEMFKTVNTHTHTYTHSDDRGLPIL